MRSTTISCTCTHPYQDARYGSGKRVGNIVGKDAKTSRCTVCGRLVTKEHADKTPDEAKADAKKAKADEKKAKSK